MKCIKKSGEIKRVSDKDADIAVKAGWSFCKKSEWKEKRGKSNNSKKSDTPVIESSETVVAEEVAEVSKGGKKGKVSKYAKKQGKSKKDKDVAATVEATKG